MSLTEGKVKEILKDLQEVCDKHGVAMFPGDGYIWLSTNPADKKPALVKIEHGDTWVTFYKLVPVVN